MKNAVQDILQSATIEEKVPAFLLGEIFERIDTENARIARKERRLWALLSLSLFGFSVIAGWRAIELIQQSTFPRYATENGTSLVQRLTQFGLSFVEALPIIGIGIFAILSTALYLSVHRYFKRKEPLSLLRKYGI